MLKFLAMNADNLIHQYRTLLDVSELIVTHQDLTALLHEISARLHALIDFDAVNLILYDPSRNTTRLQFLEVSEQNIPVPFNELPIDETPTGLVIQTQLPLFIPNLAAQTEIIKRYPKVMAFMQSLGINSLCIFPLTIATRKLGVIGFGGFREQFYNDKDLELIRQVAKQVAIAVDNALNYQEAQKYQQQLAYERDHLRLLLDVNNAVISHLELPAVFGAITASLRRVIKNDYTSLVLMNRETNDLRLSALDFAANRGLIQLDTVFPIENTPAGLAFQYRKAVNLDRHDLLQLNSEVGRRITAEGLNYMCSAPLISHERLLGTINIGRLGEPRFNESEIDLLSEVSNQIAIAVENALAFRELSELKNKINQEKLYLEDELRTEYNFSEIIGESASLRRLLQQVEIVAPTSSAVLVQGETGTGKELIARALHNLSTRRERTFVKMNCAAIPTGLLESELFGHEKGAFTGAVAQKVGRFELAHRGTIFLDEIGDIPLEIQPKLLRVLQEQEFERLGGTRTIRIDIRLIAATNRNLLEMVGNKEFRSDLYYRLNVFPLQMPPLRERSEDIPLLVRYFVQKYARRMNREIQSIPLEAMTALSRYPWPGNIRELENFIERAVILSRGKELKISLSELKSGNDNHTVMTASNISAITLEEAEREHILRVLRETNWIVGGNTGAAARLGMKRTTLQSKMQKLGINRGEKR